MSLRLAVTMVLLAPAVVLGLLVTYLGPANVFGSNPVTWTLWMTYLAIVVAYVTIGYYRDRKKRVRRDEPVRETDSNEDRIRPLGRHRSGKRARWPSLNVPTEVVMLVVALGIVAVALAIR